MSVRAENKDYPSWALMHQSVPSNEHSDPLIFFELVKALSLQQKK